MRTLRIGPPVQPFGGMNDDLRRQQLPPHLFRTLRNIEVDGESLVRRDGVVRLLSGAFPSGYLRTDGAGSSYITVPQSDTSDIADYDLGPRWALFIAYRPRSLGNEIHLILDGDGSAWSLKHKTNGTIEGSVQDADATTVTVSKTGMTELLVEYQVLMVRDNTALHLYVNNHTVETAASTLGDGVDTATSSGNIYIGGEAGNATGVFDLFEVRLFTRADDSQDWQFTQYPWTCKFGDPYLALHLLCEDGSGTTLSDFSRNANSSITITGGWTWQSSSPRQTIAPVTGLYPFEDKTGRRFLLADIGVNHYRIPV